MQNCDFKLKFHRCDLNRMFDTTCDFQVESHEQITCAKWCIIAISSSNVIDANSTIFLALLVAIVVNPGFDL